MEDAGECLRAQFGALLYKGGSSGSGLRVHQEEVEKSEAGFLAKSGGDISEMTTSYDFKQQI